MKSTTVVIVNRLGVHARPSAKVVQVCSKYQSDIMLEVDGQKVDGKSILGVMSLAAAHGSKLTNYANGADEKEAVRILEELLKNDLDG